METPNRIHIGPCGPFKFKVMSINVIYIKCVYGMVIEIGRADEIIQEIRK